MRRVSTVDGIAFRDWNLESRCLYGRIEALEFANARDQSIVGAGSPAACSSRSRQPIGDNVVLLALIGEAASYHSCWF
jgi:hypothetical protein